MSRVLAYERVRASTLRSTWIFSSIGASLALLGAVLTNATSESVEPLPLLTYVPNAYTFLSVIFITIPFAQSFGHEYRDGTMRLTLSQFPHRSDVYFAKLLIPAALATGFAVLSTFLVAIAGTTANAAENLGSLPTVLFRIVGFTLMWGLLVAAVTALTRNLAAGIMGVLVWSLLVEQLIGLASTWFSDIDQYLPLSNGQLWLTNGNGRSGLVMLVATVVLVGLAFFRFQRHDA